MPKVIDNSSERFGDLFISADTRNNLTKIGIYDNGYEVLELDELRRLKTHITNIIMKLTFKSCQ